MQRRNWVGAALAAGLVGTMPALHAQTNWRNVAVPAYTPPAFVDGLLRYWHAPRAAEFAQASRRLAERLQRGCSGAERTAARQAWQVSTRQAWQVSTRQAWQVSTRQAWRVSTRQAWRETLLAWVRLSTVAIGPLVERRPVRRIDFLPTRPEQILRAIERPPSDTGDAEAGMDRIGSAAKGFGALEWLLWSPAAPATPDACRYAARVAQDIAREATALDAAFTALRDRERDEDAVVALMSEAVNQWLGGVEQLRLQGIERPLHEARTRGRARAAFARELSGASAAERQARWQALRALAVFDATAAPAAGEGLLPLETYLRGKGLNPLADRLRAQALQADAGLRAAATAEPAQLQAAARQLARLKTLADTDVAPALDVRVGFSDADGD